MFKRKDLKGIEFKLDPQNAESKNCSSLVQENRRIYTVEHLLAVLYGMNIDSLIVEVEGNEVPIMDGSGLCFVEALQKAGIKRLTGERKWIRIDKPVVLKDKDASISVYPGSDFRITYTIEFNHPFIGKQTKSMVVEEKTFIKEIAPARTFGFLKDVPALRSRGLALGGSLENTVILDDKKVINGPLRFGDEFVRHKILDLMGDLALQRFPVLGHFEAFKAGHSLHLRLVNFIRENPHYWSYASSPCQSK